MTDVNMTQKENPRWTRCREALGREFEAWEFSLWIKQRWRDYAKFLGLADLGAAWSSHSDRVFSWYWFEHKKTMSEVHDIFDQWLKSEVEAGKYKEVP